ncbi:glutathione Stransferase [Seminavis robusta]|uniref:Glutathione Stransferase n=1 Tax=Seminavis robusta TaxID=568900 RepID=A0A9N8E269_9STRA|nr:glutathione Stransferase [Seminavis robusta]|eukprot:Sro543_g163570.1 glutathione Stransferase (399) ;mRNA; r:31726-32922
MLGPAFTAPTPSSIDSVLNPDTPTFSTERPTLFRERHGWCPYSERVWLTMELIGMDYDTVRIDNTGGPRPSYYGGQTPQMKWPDGSKQGESYDLVQALDEQYYNSKLQSSDKVQHYVDSFRSIFPRARPSSRAAFLFQYNGEPLSKSTFEETLEQTNDLLATTTDSGPFFAGSQVTAADIAWAPFLERYRYQLPCLHQGLEPDNPTEYPHLAAWFHAMEQHVPSYACRVKGDASSWRKVLSMAGFGNSGVPPAIGTNMDALTQAERETALSCVKQDVWDEYAATRPYVASTPSAEAAKIITQNRQRILQDLQKQQSYNREAAVQLPDGSKELDVVLRNLVHVLIQNGDTTSSMEGDPEMVGCLAAFLDERMCVPRDMGAMSAACIKDLAWKLSSENPK